ncbi:MAG: DUF3990 domain-containing protein [Treponema sp.]|nr:DUF3990 domain-containing protein [Treponema sp.]
MRTLKLYHGSENVIKIPQYHFGNQKNDYGVGFYCTENPELAKEWACTEEKDGFANEYLLNLEGLTVLNLSQSQYNILNWLTILLENRTFELTSEISIAAKQYLLKNFSIHYSRYDIIRGYRADDSYFSFANAFLNNTISVQKLNKAMYLGKLGEQVVLKSKKAFSQISFVSRQTAERNIYYPKKILRDSAARETFFKIHTESELTNPEALFIMDIMRGGIKNGDSRIPEILFK